MNMEETKKCPICGKDGIRDFYHEDVVCPCCGSDLSVYRKINDLVEEDDKVTNVGTRPNKVVWLLSFVSLALAIGCASLYFQKQPVKELVSVEKGMVQANQRINELEDSVEKLNSVIETFENKTLDSEQIQSNKYVVKRGDSFCRISRKELGTEKRYAEILSLNHLQANSILHIGDTLKMPKR